MRGPCRIVHNVVVRFSPTDESGHFVYPWRICDTPKLNRRESSLCDFSRINDIICLGDCSRVGRFPNAPTTVISARYIVQYSTFLAFDIAARTFTPRGKKRPTRDVENGCDNVIVLLHAHGIYNSCVNMASLFRILRAKSIECKKFLSDIEVGIYTNGSFFGR